MFRVVLVVTSCLLAAACGKAEVVVPWRLSEAPSGDELSLVAEYAGSSCTSFREWRVSESESRVTIEAIVERAEGGCTDDLVTEAGVVQLEAPLGQRQLAGCRPGSADAPCDLVEGGS